MLGVLAGLEIIRTLNDTGIKTKHPIVVVNFTNEEGARFAPPMVASGVFAGAHTLDLKLLRRNESELAARTVKDFLEHRVEMRLAQNVILHSVIAQSDMGWDAGSWGWSRQQACLHAGVNCLFIVPVRARRSRDR